MAKFDLKRLLKNEADPRRFLPYSRHVNEYMVQLDNGEFMATFRLEGMAFETADIADLNDWHEKQNIALRQVADDRVALMAHLVRSIDRYYPEGSFESEFGESLDQAYRNRIHKQNMFRNEHFLTVMMRPAVGKADRAISSLVAASRNATEQVEAAADAIETMGELVSVIKNLYSRQKPTLLKTYSHKGLVFSEPLEFVHLVMTGRKERVPLVRGHLGAALYSDRLIFGKEIVEVRSVGSSRFGGMLGIREHSSKSFPGQLNGLLEAEFEFVLGQGFAFLGKHAGLETVRKKFAQMGATDDVAVSQAEQLADMMDDVQSNRYVVGEHHLGLLVFGETPKHLNENLSVARAALSDSGMVAAREDLALEAAYWAQLPGNFAFRPRPATVNSRNYAAMAPFHTYPVGKRTGTHWGNAIAVLKTTANSPYYFSFHAGDLGHTLIIGPSGGGKTVIQNFLLSQSEKAGTRQIFIDKDRGAEIYVRASGGTYLTLKNGEPSGFAPLKALDESARNRDFLLSWLRQLVAPRGEALSADELATLAKALTAVQRLQPDLRSLSALRAQLPDTGADGLAVRLDRWVWGNELGWVFDNEKDTLALDARFMGFDMTDFLDNEDIRPPLMAYLFHRIDEVIDGRPAIVDIDEFWKALGDASFQSFVQDGLKTYRKRNALLMFGTQSPSDALKSKISETIIEQCATKILLPNPNATREHYIDGLHLTEAEFDLIKTDLSPESRRFLIKKGNDSVVVELDLKGLDDELAVLSGRSSTVQLLEDVRNEVGDDPGTWLPLFHQRRKILGLRG